MAQLFGETGRLALETGATVLGLALLAGLTAAVFATVYRWYVGERVPTGVGLLTGLAVVALLLNTTALLAPGLTTGEVDVEVLAALLNVVTFLLAGGAASVGAVAGDRAGRGLFERSSRAAVDADVSEIVQAVGRVRTVRLPEDLDDVVGYDPVPAATKETLAGRAFLFPRRASADEIADRLASRLHTDYGVGHVDLEVADDGTVTYCALGARAAGIGPTLPPATNAVAIRADPAAAASAGDLVQVWETGPSRRVLTGELRGVAGDVVTVAIDAADTSALDPTAQYKLVTLPTQERADREFAGLLRAADETLATVTVASGSSLVGVAVGDLPVMVAAITREDAAPDPLPSRDRTVAAGDVLYAVARPAALRKLTAAAEPAADGPSDADAPTDDGSPGSDPALGPDEDPAMADVEPLFESVEDGEPPPADVVDDAPADAMGHPEAGDETDATEPAAEDGDAGTARSDEPADEGEAGDRSTEPAPGEELPEADDTGNDDAQDDADGTEDPQDGDPPADSDGEREPGRMPPPDEESDDAR